jgi:hypothetical protein
MQVAEFALSCKIYSESIYHDFREFRNREKVCLNPEKIWSKE